MKRIAAVLSLAVALAIGMTSSAGAAGDPLHVRVCTTSILGCGTLADVSVRQIVPSATFYVPCDPQNPIYVPVDVPITTPSPIEGSLGVHGDIYICEP